MYEVSGEDEEILITCRGQCAHNGSNIAQLQPLMKQFRAFVKNDLENYE